MMAEVEPYTQLLLQGRGVVHGLVADGAGRRWFVGEGARLRLLDAAWKPVGSEEGVTEAPGDMWVIVPDFAWERGRTTESPRMSLANILQSLHLALAVACK
jgi:hypothetical protein